MDAALDSDAVTRMPDWWSRSCSEKVIREIAWEVVPDLAEMLLRQEMETREADGKL